MCEDTDGVNKNITEGGPGEGRLSAVGQWYKYELGCLPSDSSPVTMRLLALLLMVGAAGKDTEIHPCRRTNTNLLVHTQTFTRTAMFQRETIKTSTQSLKYPLSSHVCV